MSQVVLSFSSKEALGAVAVAMVVNYSFELLLTVIVP